MMLGTPAPQADVPFPDEYQRRDGEQGGIMNLEGAYRVPDSTIDTIPCELRLTKRLRSTAFAACFAPARAGLAVGHFVEL